MRTVVLSFEKRTNNQDLSYELGFVNMINFYTLYADEIRVLSSCDEKALERALSDTFDCMFILNSSRTDFYFPSVFQRLGLSPDANGFCLGESLISIVPDDYNGQYKDSLSAALKTHFNISAENLVFKLYGLDKGDIEGVTRAISKKYPSVFFHTATTGFDSKTTLIYGENAPKSQVDRAAREFILKLKNHIYAEDDVTLGERLRDVLKLRKQTLSTAESMTGGLIASSIVKVDGASDVFYDGLVTYNTASKERRLGVSHATVVQKTVVSSEVAYEMARGLLSEGNCTVCITVTGYAGSSVHPSDEDGLCYIGVGAGDKIQVYKYHFRGTRGENILSAANAGLFLAIKTVENLDSL